MSKILKGKEVDVGATGPRTVPRQLAGHTSERVLTSQLNNVDLSHKEESNTSSPTSGMGKGFKRNLPKFELENPKVILCNTKECRMHGDGKRTIFQPTNIQYWLG
ncbi:MAG: hypothetical protein M1820_005083 [Bogoriella megaspora]|nr:MAG: hypothetical protein M1820_005083 [Bogoriella megaspora]